MQCQEDNNQLNNRKGGFDVKEIHPITQQLIKDSNSTKIVNKIIIAILRKYRIYLSNHWAQEVSNVATPVALETENMHMTK